MVLGLKMVRRFLAIARLGVACARVLAVHEGKLIQARFEVLFRTNSESRKRDNEVSAKNGPEKH